MGHATLLHATHCACPGWFWNHPVAHASHVPVLDLCVPTLHGRHTPALAPPQPLRTSPAAAQLLHAEQLPAPAYALDVPAAHAIHTPALAPPQPLRASPALPQPPQAAHTLAPAASLNVPAGHSSQCEAVLVRGSAAPALPRLPAAHESQLVRPPSPWYLPSGHASQLSAFVVVENVPASHGAQPRSAVALGGDATRSPFAHTECGRQNPLPVNGW